MLNKILKKSKISLLRNTLINYSFFKSLQPHSNLLKYSKNCFTTNKESTGPKEEEKQQEQEESKIQINCIKNIFNSILDNNIKGTKAGDTSHYIIQFTCKKCEFRTTRMFTKRAYHHGIVLIRCEGCEGVHLIADNLGWFEDTSVNVELIIQRNGEKYKKLSAEGLFQMSTEDVFSEKNINSQEEVVEDAKH